MRLWCCDNKLQYNFVSSWRFYWLGAPYLCTYNFGCSKPWNIDAVTTLMSTIQQVPTCFRENKVRWPTLWIYAASTPNTQMLRLPESNNLNDTSVSGISSTLDFIKLSLINSIDVFVPNQLESSTLIMHSQAARDRDHQLTNSKVRVEIKWSRKHGAGQTVYYLRAPINLLRGRWPGRWDTIVGNTREVYGDGTKPWSHGVSNYKRKMLFPLCDSSVMQAMAITERPWDADRIILESSKIIWILHDNHKIEFNWFLGLQFKTPGRIY